MDQFVLIDNILKKNPTKQDLMGKKEVTYIYPGMEDIVTQQWELGDNKVINYSFSISEMESRIPCEANNYNPKYHDRKLFFKRNGIDFTPQHIRSLYIPTSKIHENGIEGLTYYLM